MSDYSQDLTPLIPIPSIDTIRDATLRGICRHIGEEMSKAAQKGLYTVEVTYEEGRAAKHSLAKVHKLFAEAGFDIWYEDEKMHLSWA